MGSKKKIVEEVRPTAPAVLVDDNTRVVVSTDDGRVVTLPREVVESGEASNYGYSIATPEQAHDRELELKYGGAGSTARAAAEGLARGASMGSYDALAIAAGASPERLREEAQRNPLASGIGEAAGIVVPALATGGSAGLGQLLARGSLKAAAKGGASALARYSPAGLVARVGRVAEPAIAKGLAGMTGQTAPGLLARATSAGLVGAGEASLYGVGETYSEAAHLGDPQLAGELLMSNMGANAVLGGSAAALFSLATGSIGRGLAKAREAASLKRLGADASAEAESFATAQAKARAAGEVSSDLETKVDVIVDETPDKTFMEMAAEKTRQRKNYVEGGIRQENMAESVQKSLTRMNKIKNTLFDKHLKMEGKIKGFIKDFQDITPEHKTELLVHSRNKILDTIEELDSRVAQKGYYEKASIRLMSELRERLHSKHLADLTELLNEPHAGKAAGKAMGLVDDTKRRLDKIVDKHHKLEKLRGDPVGDELQSISDGLRADLMDPAVWGKNATSRQAGDNAAWAKYIPQNRAKFAYLDERVRSIKGEGFIDISPADYKRILTGIKEAGSPEKTAQTLADFTQADVELIEQLARSHEGLSGEAYNLVEEYRKHSDNITRQMEEATGIADDMKEWDKFLRETADMPGVVAGARKLAITGMSMANQVSRMNVLSESTAGVASKIKTAVKSTIDTAKNTAKAVKEGTDITVKGVKEAVPYTPVIGEESHENLRDKYDKAVKVDKQHQGDMIILRDRISRVTQNISDIAPNTTLAVAQTALRASEFMLSKRPDPPIRPSDVSAHLDTRQRVSDSQMAKYLRYREGLDPINAMDKLARGQISREAAETFRAVYPEMFSVVKREVGEQLVESDTALPLNDLMKLSILLDTPLHPSFEPRFVATIQSMHAKEREEKRAPQPKKAPDTAKSYASRSDQLG